MKAPQNQVGVGNGCVFAATVTGGPRVGTGRLWTDLKCGRCVYPSERAPARTGCVDVEHGHADGKARYLTFGAYGWLACRVKQCNIGGSAAHVEADDPMDACGAGHTERADDAACRTRKNGSHRLARYRPRREDSSRRLHDAEPRMPLRETLFEAADVTRHARREIGVERDRRCPLELAEFGQYLMRERERKPQRCQGRLDGALVGRIGEGEEKRDRNRFRLRGLNLAAKFLERGFGGWMEHGAVGTDPLAQTEATVFFNNRCGAVQVPIVEAWPGLAADGQRVLKPRCSYEGYPCALALEQSVGGHGCAMAYLDGVCADSLHNFLDCFENGGGRIFGCRGKVEYFELAVGAIDAIGESATRVDGDDKPLVGAPSHLLPTYQFWLAFRLQGKLDKEL